MVTTRSRVKREAEAAVAATPTEAVDLPAPMPIKQQQRKRKNSAVSSPSSSSISSTSTLTPPSKLAKIDLGLEEFPLAPAPTPVTQPVQQPLFPSANTARAQPVDVAAAATAAAADLSAEKECLVADANANPMMEVNHQQASLPVVASQEEMAAPAMEEDLPLKLTSTAMPAITQVPTMMSTTTTTTVPDISALESVKEPVPEEKPLPEVVTVLTQPATATATTLPPAIATATTAVPTAMDFDSTTTAPTATENVPPAPTAPQISAISAPAPVPASTAPFLNFGSTLPLSSAATLTNTLVQPAPAATSLSTDKPLPPTPLETPYMATNMVAVDPTSLLLAPSTGLQDVTSSSTMTTATTTTPASVAMFPAMTTTTVGTLPYQLQATGTKGVNGSAADIAMVTNDIQPQLMPQQQLNRSGKILSAPADTAGIATANAKGPNQSGV